MTCTVTNHPILEQFAVPVFADIQLDTGNIDPKDVEKRITPRTRAIVCTHWAGYPCDLEELNEVAERHHIPVIEDASEAFGAIYHGRPIGGISRFTAFSFQAVQIITTGEGGLLPREPLPMPMRPRQNAGTASTANDGVPISWGTMISMSLAWAMAII